MEERASLLRQPKAVWAVAFACVIAFMGIGLVDPILPALAQSLDATPSQVELLFTSYFAITGIAMLVTGFVSSRIGAKRTLLAGLALIVAFSAAAGASGSIGQIVAFRGVWGLGNALFIATALAAIVGAASGGLGGAIVLFEAALGLGIASGPLLGGELGSLSWRAPFFGVAALMATAFVLILLLLERTPAPPMRSSLGQPLRALRERGLRGVALTALFYNFGFFTLIAFTPFPLELGIHQLGYVFFGWGVLLAISSVWLAPRLRDAFGLMPVLYGAFALVALDLFGMALWTDSQTALILLVIVAGLFLGVVNTLVTETVMRVSTTERATASAAYSFVRFIGGAAAPYLAGKLAEHFDAHVPFFVAAASVAVAIGVLAWHRDDIAEPQDVAARLPTAFAEELLEADAA
ncbi:MAG TPA: MFS transporter [Gaiellaceae bacterium]|jgi:MFS family permease